MGRLLPLRQQRLTTQSSTPVGLLGTRQTVAQEAGKKYWKRAPKPANQAHLQQANCLPHPKEKSGASQPTSRHPHPSPSCRPARVRSTPRPESFTAKTRTSTSWTRSASETSAAISTTPVGQTSWFKTVSWTRTTSGSRGSRSSQSGKSPPAKSLAGITITLLTRLLAKRFTASAGLKTVVEDCCENFIQLFFPCVTMCIFSIYNKSHISP